MQVVAHNIQAQFANRNLGVVTTNQSKSMEKLSSGYRVNRAADDAAGLAVSEKMRWHIRNEMEQLAGEINRISDSA